MRKNFVEYFAEERNSDDRAHILTQGIVERYILVGEVGKRAVRWTQIRLFFIIQDVACLTCKKVKTFTSDSQIEWRQIASYQSSD